MRGLLRAVCRPDPIHVPARVVTVYCDTPEFQSLDEKVNSDYLKTKIRVRWYEPLGGAGAGDVVFVECKYRVGATRRKVRVRSTQDPGQVARWPLEGADWRQLLDPLTIEGVDLPPNVGPVLRLAYVRERFTDPMGDGRLTLDTEMTVQAVNSFRLRPGLAGRLAGAVVEYKDSAVELPSHLRVIVHAGARKTSFSKYLAAYTHITRASF